MAQLKDSLITGDLRVTGTIYGLVTTASSIQDAGDSRTLTAAYSKDGLAYADYTWLAAWNGNELRAVAKSQFAQASHTHNYLPLSGGTLTGALTSPYFDASSSAAPTAGKLSGLTTAHSRLYGNALYLSNPSTTNDQGWIRITGTGESDTVLEIATGDDAGVGEQIVVRQYNTSNAVARQLTLLDTSGNTSIPGQLTAASGSIWAGTDGNTAAERDLGVQSGAGRIYMWSAAATNGSRGIWLSAHGTDTSGHAVFNVDTNNNVTFNGTLNGNAYSVTNVYGLSAVGDLGWGTAENRTKIPNISCLAYWNGAYSGSSSNLTYCAKGAFGTGATKNISHGTGTPSGGSNGDIYVQHA